MCSFLLIEFNCSICKGPTDEHLLVKWATCLNIVIIIIIIIIIIITVTIIIIKIIIIVNIIIIIIITLRMLILTAQLMKEPFNRTIDVFPYY